MKKTVKHLLLLALVIGLTAPVLVLAQCGSCKGCGIPCGDSKDVKKTSHPTDCSCVECSKMKNSSMKTSAMKEGNVWVTQDGTKYFTCPVMKTEMKVEDAKTSSVINGVKYYHCCPGCETPFQTETVKWLKGFAVPGNVFNVDQNGQKHFRDPVNGETGVANDKTVNVEMDGFRYFFTSKKTMKTFEKSPQDYKTCEGT